MKIIPAIDIIEGKCVRLTQGDYSQKKIYNENPVEVAKEFEGAGLRFLHVVDLDGAKAGSIKNLKTIEAIVNNTKLIVDVGGGIKTAQDIRLLFESGVAQVNLGSIAIKDSRLVCEWLAQFGIDRIIISADVRNERIALHGWLEQSETSIYDFIASFNEPNLYVTCTDIANDGMLSGTNTKLYQSILKQYPSVRLIASGGVSKIGDLDELKKIVVEGVIIGKAIYENKISLNELAHYAN
jgi:phosphoribosylformimino-5-aminoimidazole carboxamide ribotide isomerase